MSGLVKADHEMIIKLHYYLILNFFHIKGFNLSNSSEVIYILYSKLITEYYFNKNISYQNNPFTHMMLNMKRCENGKEFVDPLIR